MEVSKSLVEKGLKLNKQKKMCPTNFTFYFEMRMFCTHQTPDQAHILNSDASLSSLSTSFDPLVSEKRPLKIESVVLIQPTDILC